jgi:hypothetical protein
MPVIRALVIIAIVVGPVLMFITGMVRYGVLLIALAFVLLTILGGLAMSDGDSARRRILLLGPFAVAAILVGVGVCGIFGLFAAHTDAYIYARGQDVQLEVPQVGPGEAPSGGLGMCDQVGSEAGSGEWSCQLSWQDNGSTVDGYAYLSGADLDSKDTVAGRAIGSTAVSIAVGESRATSQVVLGDIPWWVIPAAFGAAILAAVGGSGLRRLAR